jgi:hypothetical protein
MKKSITLVLLAVLLSVGISYGQAAPAKTLSMRGSLDIAFNTRIQVDDQGLPNKGVTDVYKLKLDMCDTVIFSGAITYLPGLFSQVLGRYEQQATLQYALDVGIRNPANLADEKMIGRLVGGVPIDAKGVYQFNQGTLRMAVDSMGKAAGFESAFKGVALGKPLKKASALDQLKQQAMTFQKQVQGKTVALKVTDYDKMTFADLVMSAGPVKTYPECRLNGEMVYDYERSAWYFNGLVMNYIIDGKPYADKLSGHIKWIESPQRKTTGEGKYVFDIRVNEQQNAPVGEAAAFAGADDESAFFAVDNTVMGLTGDAAYKDTMRGEDVTASSVTINLTGNQLTKVQMVNLGKMLWLVDIVPLNAE